MSKIQFKVNGNTCIVDECTPRDTSLNAYIRYTLVLPGTKAMCRKGGCGACIVMVRAKRCTSGVVETFSVNSCLVLVFSCNGWDITTIEGVGDRLNGYGDVQKRIAAFSGTQCGYCTPGFVMQMNSLKNKHLTMAELEKSFGSNTCRCTGFRPILDTMKSFASDASPQLRQKVRDIEDLNVCKKSCAKENCSAEKKCFKLDEYETLIEDFVTVENTIAFDFGNLKSKYFKVYEENDVFDVLSKYGSDSYILLDGNTGKGIYETLYYRRIMIDISEVCSLKGFLLDQNLILGANVSIEDCITIFKDISKEHSEFFYLNEFVKHFYMIAHIPVRKIGSLAGNLMLKYMNPAYQSDVFLLFESVGAVLTIRDSNGRKKTLNLLDFLKYDMQEKLMVSISLPPLSQERAIRTYKIMPRNQNALAIVNAAFNLKLKNNVIEAATIVYGNISATFNHAYKTERFLIGKNVYTNKVLQDALKVLSKEVVPVERLPEPSTECRKKIALGLFYKFVLNTAPVGTVQDTFQSGSIVFDRPVSKGTQDFQSDRSLYPLNQPVPKLEGQIQSSGEAHYSNDLPPSRHDVYGAFVLSTVHSGEVDRINTKEVLARKGVLALYTAADIPGTNSFIVPGIQLQTEDEEILATTIKFYGQPVAILVAISEELAAREATKVQVTYKNVSSAPPVLTIDAAKRDSKRYVADESSIEPIGKGTDVQTVVKGVYEIEAQYHYYLEPVTCVVVPIDRGFEVYDSTQWIDLTQQSIARSLNIQESEVTVIVRRVGGGFGGKISRNVQASTAAALVAKKLNTTCRFILPLETNLTIAGRRLPTQCDYEILVALSFYATGSYQRLVGGTHGTMMSQQSVSRAIKEVTAALNNEGILNKWLKFPQTRQQRDSIKRRFYEKFKIPAVEGCIDGTHIAIIKPSQNEERFYNRKGFHSRNVLIAGVDANGKIQYLNATIVQDVGCSTNENILSYVTGGFPNCYNKDYFSLKTAMVITDLPSNTFARAPGTCEGISSIEHIMEHIAFAVKKDPVSVRLANMRETDNDIPALIEIMKTKSDYDNRCEEVKQFNQNNRWMKKAINISVMSFPIEYFGNYSALVTVYRGDGTVTVTTGGIEMGQGANTKAAQVCAYELGIPLDQVKVIPHYSFTAANNVFSGSSITSESVCYSIIKACKIIKERLAPLRASMPSATWKELIVKAGEEQIDLTAIYMMTDYEEDLKSYSAFGVVVLEVTLDVMTGRFQIDRVDFLEDVGLSANPIIDVGQVEGAYIQGIGYFTCEKLVYDPCTGKLLTNNSLTYHVPLANDIPLLFNVTMRYNSKNVNGVLGSKTCGEMGVCLTHGITHALRRCIMESRKDSGYNANQFINIEIPYDTESILKALDVKLDEFVLSK